MRVLTQALEALRDGLDMVSELAPDFQRLSDRTRELVQRVAIFSDVPNPEGVRWLEVSAQLRMGGVEALATPYGLLVAAKVLALIGLGAFGAAYRRSIIRRSRSMSSSSTRRARKRTWSRPSVAHWRATACCGPSATRCGRW